jgi:hypothetical protein
MPTTKRTPIPALSPEELEASPANGNGKKAATTVITITPPKLETVEFQIEGTAPLVIHRFSQKVMAEMMETQAAGSTAKTKKKREPKDFDRLMEDAKHVSDDGWEGVHAAAFRNGAISACRTCGVQMTRAKLAFWVIADGFDRVDGVPLVRLTKGEAERHLAPVRNRTGVSDIRCRPMYREWGLTLRIQFDRDMFSPSDVANLINRVGHQVGIGEGRPDSKDSPGCGWGLFRIV